MKWAKQGLVYAPDGRLPWAKKHAFPPTPIRLHEGEIRIYLSFTDDDSVGRLAYIDVDARNPKRILRMSERPLLDVGHPGAFDDNGVVPTSIVRVGDQLYLYYVGFQLGHRVRYFQFQGLAISDDGGESFSRYRRTPIIERSEQELVNRTSAFVMHDGGRFRMWYVGGSDWTHVGEKALPVYEIRYLESVDGKTWGAEGKVAVQLKEGGDEHALGRAWVLSHEGRYRMFFSRRSRSQGYRIGYAESEDGIDWRRDDDRVGLDVSPEGWDSKMVAYTSVIEGDGAWYLFYNGNDCGQSGFGYATLEEW